MHIKFLALICFLGNSAIAKKTDVTFNVIEAEGTIDTDRRAKKTKGSRSPSESPSESAQPSESPSESAQPSASPSESGQPSGSPSESAPPSESPSVSYFDKVFLQVNNLDNRWLSGARTTDTYDSIYSYQGTYTSDYLGNTYENVDAATTYQWIVRSTAGDGKRDCVEPKANDCVKYGNKVFLQSSALDDSWLSGGRGAGNEGVVTRDYLGIPYERLGKAAYQWIVRSAAGDGTRDYEDPKANECVEYGDKVFLQTLNALDNRWLSGGRGSGNARVVTRDYLGIPYEKTAATSYQWTVQRTAGDGTRDFVAL